MLYISNIEFVNKYLMDKTNIDQLLFFCEVIKKLSKKYGKKLLSETLLKKIEGVDLELVDFIRILKIGGKLNLRKISDIQRIIKESSTDYTKSFELESINPQNIENSVVDKLKAISGKVAVGTKQSNTVGLKVKGEGMYYNRTLENDLEKLLD